MKKRDLKEALGVDEDRAFTDRLVWSDSGDQAVPVEDLLRAIDALTPEQRVSAVVRYDDQGLGIYVAGE